MFSTIPYYTAQRIGSAAAAGLARLLFNMRHFWQITPARSGRAAVRLEPVLGGVLRINHDPAFNPALTFCISSLAISRRGIPQVTLSGALELEVELYSSSSLTCRGSFAANASNVYRTFSVPIAPRIRMMVSRNLGSPYS